ncbi:MAG: 6-carboxytetrahydropterin synthase QueD [Synergistaceae bacterium]|nr:6-carboxytetrahydropterin synthase QueD [Synergistaceae bacterium]
MKLRKEFTFDAAHNLVRYHGKCEKLHGHTYRVAVVLDGTLDDEGMILDFCVLASIVQERAISKLDHSYLNELIPQPTAENIALWIWGCIEEPLRCPNCHLSEVWVWETAESCAVLTEADSALIKP